MSLASVPLAGKKNTQEEKKSDWSPSSEQEAVLKRVTKRVKTMLNYRGKYEGDIKESILLYEGKTKNTNKDDPRDFDTVIPVGRMFVESKTAEEIKAMNEYEFVPMKQSSDSWRVDLLKDLNRHVQRKVKLRGKRHQVVRMKNIAGVGILRVGYRKVMRYIKERIEGDDDALNVQWKKVLAPMYDDLFADVVSPLDFAVDPNATTMDDANDCYHSHIENYDVVQEVYGNDPRWQDVDKVERGVKYIMTDQGLRFDQFVQDDGVIVEEYFCKSLDEWVLVLNGVMISPIDNPLPDDHKELPFVSYHNHPSFAQSVTGNAYTTNSSGQEASPTLNVDTNESFWTKGDPIVLKDQIDLTTGFTRQMYRNLKLSAETIVATDKGAAFNDKRPWRTGDQAKGMKGKFEVVPLAKSTAGEVTPVLDKLFEYMVLTAGADPRNLAGQSPSETATATAVKRETSMRRLEQNVEYNEENGETRLGKLFFMLEQQYYSKPEVVRLTGYTKEQVEKFDDVVSDDLGNPVYGKRMRRIKTDMKVSERKQKQKDGSYKYYLTKSEDGVHSFLSRPEYIRSSEVDVVVSTTRKLGEIRAVTAAQAREEIQLYTSLYELSVKPQDGSEPAINREDLPDITEAIRNYQVALGRNPDALNNNKDEEEDDPDDAKMEEYRRGRQDLSNVPKNAPDPAMAAQLGQNPQPAPSPDGAPQPQV